MKRLLCLALLVSFALAGCGRVGRSNAPEGEGMKGMDDPESMAPATPPPV